MAIKLYGPALAVALLSSSVAWAAAPPAPQILLGQVKSVSPTSITVAVNGKVETLGVSPQLTVYLLKPTTPDQIKPGSFIGATNLPTIAGRGRATEIHIFPPGVKRGEGDRPWPSATTGSGGAAMMTNGTVSTGAPAQTSAMTNGSVGAIGGAGGTLSFDIVYAGGTKRVTVPPGTQITTMNPGTLKDVKPGARVTVIATNPPGGARQATLINVEPPGK